MILGYASAATLAALAGAFEFNLAACIGIFWIGGAVLTISLFAVRLTLLSNRPKQASAKTNVIQLHSAAGRPALVTQQGIPALRHDFGDRST